jgi:multidrug efflux pump subunit AcrA (membrane-fusion protein)
MSKLKVLLADNKNRAFAIGIPLLALAAVIGIGFSSTEAREQPGSRAVVVSLNVEETVEASGALEAQPFASLAWKTGGVVSAVYVEPGDMVRKGDILLALEPASTSATLASAQADLVEAQKNLEDLIHSDSELAQAVIAHDEAQEKFDDKSRYFSYLQNSERVPLTETRGWYEKARMGGWTYVSKTRYFSGPATKDMLIEAQNNMELARAALEDAQREVDRLKNREKDLLAAQARVDAAQATVNSMRIVAPFDGQVLSVDGRPGDTVNSGDLSVNLADMDHLFVDARVDETDIASIALGNPVEVRLEALPAVTLRGEVSAINPVGVVVTGLVKYGVRIELDQVEKDVFLPLGTTANVVIQVREETPALAVPIKAIQNDGKGEFVTVLQDADTTRRVDILSGAIIGDLVVVSGDLKPGDPLQLPQGSSFEAPNPFGGGD